MSLWLYEGCCGLVMDDIALRFGFEDMIPDRKQANALDFNHNLSSILLSLWCQGSPYPSSCRRLAPPGSAGTSPGRKRARRLWCR